MQDQVEQLEKEAKMETRKFFRTYKIEFGEQIDHGNEE